ncbi:tRNA (adenosine(37)-N6)-threonylcarbamoyltransferase complex ATPase subunit type 1 TsaE [Candidatus Saccharibacteria bacterium]|nr:tRNA (adenosine(37)-N6)-threonylcarbamoyltransferase complex ATPase subunit type 1 TsaE [Candidatus Saccharibacteria bacterium]
MKINSEQEMLDFGESFAKKSSERIIELVGDVGAGKTTFVRGLAKGLGIKEPITSPSFTISKTYALPTGGNLIHYDFYRLSDPGIMLDDLNENLKNPENLIVVEWGESISKILPKNHLKIKIAYDETGGRAILFL